MMRIVPIIFRVLLKSFQAGGRNKTSETERSNMKKIYVVSEIYMRQMPRTNCKREKGGHSKRL